MPRVFFIHPDLGIGGAERLVVDAVTALQNRDHDVRVFTSHHDTSHCFDETRNFSISVIGDWLPRSIKGRFVALCATLRMILVALYMVFRVDERPDIVFCDQVSTPVPIFKWFYPSTTKVIFYCHFPDLLLTKRDSTLKSIYRKVVDKLEETTTGMADVILVNSRFTAGIFKETFKSLSNIHPVVLYPTINTKAFDKMAEDIDEVDDLSDNVTFVSINRFERKKNLQLAIEAFAILKGMHVVRDNLKLIIAGGYDSRLKECVEYYEELRRLADALSISSSVDFVKSPSDREKCRLLVSARALLYTPSGEHFGIVPLEAMHFGVPVIAVNNGGPLETVADGETGLLVADTAQDFADAMSKILDDEDSKKSMGGKGRERVRDIFSFEAFEDKLDRLVQQNSQNSLSSKLCDQ